MTTLLYLQTGTLGASASSSGKEKIMITRFHYWAPGACAIQVRTLASGPGALFVKAGQAQEHAEIAGGDGTPINVAVNVPNPDGRPVLVEVWINGPMLGSGWRGMTLLATQVDAIPLPPAR